jgi:DNA-binding transcriptional ArsR family regulator
VHGNTHAGRVLARRSEEGNSLSTNDILSVASRRRIYECVVENPGAHLREITRRCGMPLGTALYHLDCLDSGGVVVSRRDGRYKRYFVAHALGRREKELMSALRHDVPRRIVTVLLAKGSQSQRSLCEAIGVSRSTLSFHVNNLVRQQIVRRIEGWPEHRYVVEDVELSRQLLLKFRESLAEGGDSAFAPMLDHLERVEADAGAASAASMPAPHNEPAAPIPGGYA